MSYIDKENRNPNQSSFAAKAAKSAVSKLSDIQTNTTTKPPTPDQIDKVVESVANATKRLSQHSTTSNSSKRKVENRIGPWRLGRTLGKGSTGRVRLAKHSTTGKLAAIKIIPKTILDVDTNDNSRKKKKKKQRIDENGLPYGIEREIIIMKLISHPNIMALYDVWENNNELYLVLEYVQGGELFDFLINNGKLEEKSAVEYFRMIINGVSYCHKFNICHRDLKPENILLDKNGRIKIADFGMAALETQQKLLETSCGSPHYASPEIVAGKTYHGSPSDVWSCGVILFALLTGHLPFDDPSIRQLLMKVQSGKFHMPSGLSSDAKDLIWSMLRVDPDQRIRIEDIYKHPLMLKYPEESVDEIEDKLDHLDISKPVENIDMDILNNLQTLWHGIPKSHVIKMLQNSSKNSEKMFYYLLENYKLTHADEINPTPPNLKKSISKTNVRSKSSKTHIPRSKSTVITTIEDETGNVLKAEVQELDSSPLKPKEKRVTRSKPKNISTPTNNSIIASTSFNKSVSFRKLKRESTSSTLSIVNMKRNLSIRPDNSLANLASIINETNSETKSKIKNLISTSPIGEKEIKNSRSFTVNPKDLPDLPDLKDFKYLVNSFFADDEEYMSKSFSKKEGKSQNPEEITVFDVLNTSLPSIDENSKLSINASSLDPKNDKSPLVTSLRELPKDNSKSALVELVSDNPPQLTKLELLKKELNSKKQTNGSLSSISTLRKVSGMKSVKSSSTRQLNTFLNEEYKNTKLDELTLKMKHPSSKSSKSPKTLRSIETKMSDRSHEFIGDTTYSLHSFVEVKMTTPTEEELRQLHNKPREIIVNDDRYFEDADDSYLDQNLISDSAIQNSTVHKAPNIDNKNISDIRYSLLTTSTNDNHDINDLNKLKWRKSEDIMEKELDEIKHDKSLASVFDDANDDEDSFVKNVPLRKDLTEAHDTKDVIRPIERSISPHESINPFSEFKDKIRSSMTPTQTSQSTFQQNDVYIKPHAKTENLPGKVAVSSMNTVFSLNHKEKPQPHKPSMNNKITSTLRQVSANATSSLNFETPVMRSPPFAEKEEIPHHESKPSRRSKWIKKLMSAFSKLPSAAFEDDSNEPSKTPNTLRNFFSKFNKGSSKKSQHSTSQPEQHWLESDVVTREILLSELKKDPNTQSLKLVSSKELNNGCKYTLQFPNPKTTVEVEIIDKIGAEFGFGGCYIRFIKIKGSSKSFDFLCGNIRDVVVALEKANDDLD